MFAHVCARRLAGVHVSPQNVNRPKDFLPADQTEISGEREGGRGREDANDANGEERGMIEVGEREGRPRF